LTSYFAGKQFGYGGPPARL